MWFELSKLSTLVCKTVFNNNRNIIFDLQFLLVSSTKVCNMDDLSFLALFDVPPCFVCGKKTKEMEDPLWWCPSQKHGIHIFTCATRGQCECRAAQLLMCE